MQNLLPVWQRARRYSVPDSMVAECARLRQAGDWAGTLRAGRVEADIDLARVATKFGRGAAEQLEADLAGLAPDLLRWHLPRGFYGDGGFLAGATVVLSRAPAIQPGTPVLLLRLPTGFRSPQRLSLHVGRLRELERRNNDRLVDLPPYYWHADEAHHLRGAHGGDAHRLPRFQTDGAPLPRESFGTSGDPAAQAELVHEQHLLGDAGAALHLAGIELDARAAEQVARWDWASDHLCAVGIADEVRRLARRHRRHNVRWGLLQLRVGWGSRVKGRLWQWHTDQNAIDVVWPRPTPDLELVWRGMMRPGELHPMVREVLFPGVGRPHVVPVKMVW